MKFDLQQWEIQGLSKNYNLLDIPPFQREEEIWSPKKKQLFIDTIVKGWPIPKIYLHNTPDGKYEIVDGQQRISTILLFLNNKFKIKNQSGDNDVNFNGLEPIVRDVGILSTALIFMVLHFGSFDLTGQFGDCLASIVCGINMIETRTNIVIIEIITFFIKLILIIMIYRFSGINLDFHHA
jgi:hypothetical protein